jgi:acetyl-CoA C-acetyltransferase
MSEAYIVDAVRTPIGRKKGSLATLHSADLGAHAIKALMQRTGLDPAAVDDVVFGCTETIGSQAGDIARTCWLVAGLPDHVPGVTIDRQCGSAQQAVHFAAQGVMSGTQDLVVAGGVQNLNMIPISAAMLAGQQFGIPDPFSTSPGWRAHYGTQEVGQFRAAQMIADKWQIGASKWNASHCAVTKTPSPPSTAVVLKTRSHPLAISTRWKNAACASDCRQCAKAGVRPTSPSSSVCS